LGIEALASFDPETVTDISHGQAEHWTVPEAGAKVVADDRLVLSPRCRSKSRFDIIQPPLEVGSKPKSSGIARHLLVALPRQLAEQQQALALGGSGR
jgi:hypothetical protein